ncbi:unnamed protein product [Ceutorhynchus assimilis]|uniref:Uncharacterized protein n=1 Tax=Ceutorhynchus assimilis TaxID=467358 RepID=A0A9N9N0K8_9CUCU|nr:unnamed protein product [Ceutorhynchus assimilis]
MNEGVNSPNETTKKPSKKSKLERSIKLPTPPPDPWDNVHTTYPKTPGPGKDAEDKEKTERSSDKDKELFEYIESLHKSLYSRTSSAFAPAIVTEEAFDHMERLYKLMDQMLELRDQNVKLHRRIRDLEHLNQLERLTLNPDAAEEDYPDLERDTAFAEAILDSMLQDPKNKDLPKYKAERHSLLKRHRSGSGPDKQVADVALLAEREKKVRRDSKCDKQSKVSKWTKVKAAFR